MAPNRIPLFPLDVVLFPGMPLPLHIFEPRYKEMIRRCVAEQLPFGVVLARTEGFASVGCIAEVTRVVREYPDGRMDILSIGRDVFSIVETYDEKSYLEAGAEFREEEPTQDFGNQDELSRLFAESHILLFGHANATLEPDSGIPLSYQVLGALPFELDFKQQMLELDSEGLRQQKLLSHLKQWLSQLAHRNRVRGKAGGNGHGAR